jgi:hypothetical protein
MFLDGLSQTTKPAKLWEGSRIAPPRTSPMCCQRDGPAGRSHLNWTQSPLPRRTNTERGSDVFFQASFLGGGAGRSTPEARQRSLKSLRAILLSLAVPDLANALRVKRWCAGHLFWRTRTAPDLDLFWRLSGYCASEADPRIPFHSPCRPQHPVNQLPVLTRECENSEGENVGCDWNPDGCARYP